MKWNQSAGCLAVLLRFRRQPGVASRCRPGCCCKPWRPRSSPIIAFEIDPSGHIAVHGVTDGRVVRRVVVINAMVAVAIQQIADVKITTSCTVIARYPGVFIAIANIMQDGIVIAAVQPNSAGIPLIPFGIAEGDVVTDQVIVGTTGQVNAVFAVVLGDVPADGGIGGATQIDALTDGTRGRAAGEADVVVRERDVVRAEYVNPFASCTGDGEAIHHDVAFAGDAEAIIVGRGPSDRNIRRSRIGDGGPGRAGIWHGHRFSVRASHHMHGFASHDDTGGFADGAEGSGGVCPQTGIATGTIRLVHIVGGIGTGKGDILAIRNAGIVPGISPHMVERSRGRPADRAGESAGRVKRTIHALVV